MSIHALQREEIPFGCSLKPTSATVSKRQFRISAGGRFQLPKIIFPDNFGRCGNESPNYFVNCGKQTHSRGHHNYQMHFSWVDNTI
ncbi:hypothetical protein CDAR_497331 [Caerostris darwini]|uniref:Uncharacterized protein n=1 Tax=Caerostris darwini TaxID=1538125 RepID=A0AAV4S4C4_9ARAC|nr:hypothetical protein CDAR_497331 [Caerostris darwini]